MTSASAVRALGLYDVPHFFIKRQLIWLGVAAVFAYGVSRFDYHYWRQYPLLTITFYVLVVIGLVLVFVPVIGGKVNGSYRWLNIGPFRVQPSEFAKFSSVVALSVWMDDIGWRVKQRLKGAAVPALIIGCFAGLIVIESDFGAMAVVSILGGGLMYVAGTRAKHLFFLGVIGLVLVGALLAANPNRMARIRGWVEGFLGGQEKVTTAVPDPRVASSKYQIDQAVLAFKNGGLLGVGYNKSIQKHNYLPEPHTDCIMAIGGEEFGFVFSAGVLVAFAVLLVCGVLICAHAPDRLGRLLAFGMTVLLVFQAIFNIGVVTGCLPPKGLAMPFISYGGTNLVVALAAVGTLFNIGLHVDVFDERMHTQVARNAVKQM